MIDKTAIENQVSHEEIFARYFMWPTRKRVRNPLRKDNHPDCSFFKNRDDIVLFHDFANKKSYTCYGFIMELYGCNFYEALKIIDQDFGLGLHEKAFKRRKKKEIKNQMKKVKHKEFDIIEQDWTEESVAYWLNLGVSMELLYDCVIPVKEFFVNGRRVWAHTTDPIFAYPLESNIYQLYRPLTKLKKNKFRYNGTVDYLLGMNQLPWVGDLLIITKSMKDILVLRSMGYNAVAPVGEGTRIPSKLMKGLQKRFSSLLVFFDNDSPGIKAAQTLCSTYDISYMHFPTMKEKDVSDHVLNQGYLKTKAVVNQMICAKLDRQSKKWISSDNVSQTQKEYH